MRHLVAKIAATITAGITALAFAISFAALADLTRLAGLGDLQAWAWPIVVDGLIVVATMAVMSLRGRPGYGFAWLMLCGASAVSLLGNVAHALLVPTGVPTAVAVGVASVPPIWILASTHLTIVLLRAAAAADLAAPTPDTAAEVRTEQVTAPAAPAEDDDDRQSRHAAPEPDMADWTAPAAPADAAPAPELAAAADRVEVARQMHEVGHSKRGIARHLGVDDKTVRRWLAEADATT